MKIKNSIITIILAIFSLQLFSQETTSIIAIQVAENQIKNNEKSQIFTIYKTSTLSFNSIKLAYIFHLNPIGYIVVSTSMNLPPIPAYSYESDFGVLNQSNPLFIMLKNDLISQMEYCKSNDSEFEKHNRQKWTALLSTNSYLDNDEFQQWPTDRDGWLLTNWTQTAPFSNFCPMDPVTSQRSYAGCPATAMSQILNFHKTINGIHFTDSDDYFHNYAGRQYYIDDDFASNGFPSFPDLNKYLDTLQNHWNIGTTLTNNDKAALTFACGVAATQVYTSEGSGTFSVSQALDAYQRFGCTSSVLIQPDDEELINRMAQNIKDTLPIHLAVVDEGWTTGHNVVVDGYNSDGYFHLNFGWGGSSNGWYLLPQEMPYNLTSFEGAVVDIMKKNSVGISEKSVLLKNIYLFPNPTKGRFTVNCPENYVITEIVISNQIGKVILKTKSKQIDLSNTSSGIYTIKIAGVGFEKKLKIVINK